MALSWFGRLTSSAACDLLLRRPSMRFHILPPSEMKVVLRTDRQEGSGLLAIDRLCHTASNLGFFSEPSTSCWPPSISYVAPVVRRVHHEVDGKRGDVGRADHASDRQRRAELLAFLLGRRESWPHFLQLSSKENSSAIAIQRGEAAVNAWPPGFKDSDRTLCRLPVVPPPSGAERPRISGMRRSPASLVMAWLNVLETERLNA